MVTSKCEAEIGLFLTDTPKKKERKKEKRKGRARGSMSERVKQVGEKENLEKQIFLFLNDNGF